VNKIKWQDAPYNTKYGLVGGQAGGLQLFAITWKSRREDPDWLMRCELPGYVGREWKDGDIEALKDAAESTLALWLAKVGGIRPADQEDAAFRAWYERADIGPDLEWCAVEGFLAGWNARGGETS
jgi:hypothetical protein